MSKLKKALKKLEKGFKKFAKSDLGKVVLGAAILFGIPGAGGVLGKGLIGVGKKVLAKGGMLKAIGPITPTENLRTFISMSEKFLKNPIVREAAGMAIRGVMQNKMQREAEKEALDFAQRTYTPIQWTPSPPPATAGVPEIPQLPQL